MQANKHKLQIAALCLLPLLLLAYYWLSNPFSDTLCSRTFALSDLSAAQKSNILRAAQALNGLIVKSQGDFSFNQVVGNRTTARGYLPAPSYLGNDSPNTIGGGICLVSSAIYQVALESGLTIIERTPHLRTIRSIEPGLDATVWYGQADLRFNNSQSYPIQLCCNGDNNQLKVTLKGPSGAGKENRITIQRLVEHLSKDQIRVCVLRQQGTEEILVSRDLYRLPGFQPPGSNNHR